MNRHEYVEDNPQTMSEEEALEALKGVVHTYDDGLAFYNWWYQDQGLRYKKKYFSCSFRYIGRLLVDTVVANGNNKTLRIDSSDEYSYMNFYCSEGIEEEERIERALEERVQKFRDADFEVLDFSEVYRRMKRKGRYLKNKNK